MIHQAGLNGGEVILVADGASADASAAAAQARAAGVHVSVLGIGSVEGAPVALAQGGFLKDAAGRIVLPKLDVSALAKLASAGGGYYSTYSSDAHDLETILPPPAAEASNPTSVGEAQSPRFLDRAHGCYCCCCRLSRWDFVVAG